MSTNKRLLAQTETISEIVVSKVDGVLWLFVAFFFPLVIFSPLIANAEELNITDLIGATQQRQSSTSYESEYAYGAAMKETQKFEFNVIHDENWPLADDFNLIAVGRIHADLFDNLQPGKPGQQEVAPVSRTYMVGDRVDVELRELYLKKSIGESLLQVGKQQVVWGNADGLRVLDVVDPFSFSEFTLDEYEGARIPRWKLNYQTPVGTANFQFLWIPDNSYHDFPDEGSTYSITSEHYVPPSAPAGVIVNQPPAKHPYRFFADSDVGARITGRIDAWDVSVAYLYSYYPIPIFYRTLEITTQGPVVNVDERYERTHLVGGTFSNAFGNTVVRGEVGYTTDRYFLTGDIESGKGVLKADELSYVIGLDFYHISRTLISAQVFQSRLTDSAPTLKRDVVDTTFTLLVNRTFSNEKWHAEMLWIQNDNDHDGLLRPKITYSGVDNLSLWVGADVFYGDENGTFGQFDKNDRLVVGAKWYN